MITNITQDVTLQHSSMTASRQWQGGQGARGRELDPFPRFPLPCRWKQHPGAGVTFTRQSLLLQLFITQYVNLQDMHFNQIHDR